VADFCKETSVGFYEQIMKQVEDLNIGLVILNAGIADFAPFIDTSADKVQ